MSGVRWVMPPVEVTTATATLTLAQLIAASNRRVRIDRVTVTGKGITSSDVPVLFEILKQTTAGTSSSTANPTKMNASDDETLGVTANKTFTVEPTAGDVRAGRAIHPQTGWDFVFPFGRELYVGGGERLGIRVNSPAQVNTWVISAEGDE